MLDTRTVVLDCLCVSPAVFRRHAPSSYAVWTITNTLFIMPAAVWTDRVIWSTLARGERLQVIAERFTSMSEADITPQNVDLLYRTAAEMAPILESADDSSSMYSSMHPDHFTVMAYRARSEFLRVLTATVSSDSFIKQLEEHLSHVASQLGIELSTTPVVWSIPGRFPPHRNAREIMLYLAALQIGSEFDKIGIHQAFLVPHMVPADILVSTPRWVASFVREISPSSVGEIYELSAVELDYLRGLRRFRRRLEDLPAAVRAAKLLARASNRTTTV